MPDDVFAISVPCPLSLVERSSEFGSDPLNLIIGAISVRPDQLMGHEICMTAHRDGCSIYPDCAARAQTFGLHSLKIMYHEAYSDPRQRAVQIGRAGEGPVRTHYLLRLEEHSTHLCLCKSELRYGSSKNSDGRWRGGRSRRVSRPLRPLSTEGLSRCEQPCSPSCGVSLRDNGPKISLNSSVSELLQRLPPKQPSCL